MKLPILLTALCLCLLPLHAARAQFGRYVTSFDFAPEKLLADPVRPRVYASVPALNRVMVIDTDSMSVIASVHVKPKPARTAISPDGNTLYVLTRKAAKGIGVIDLNTLQPAGVIALPMPGLDIAAGLNGRLYVSAFGTDGVYQVDSTTGAVQAPVYSVYKSTPSVRWLQLSPDDRTLYGDDDQLSSFDVTGSTPALLVAGTSAVQASDLVISHHGAFLHAPGAELETRGLGGGEYLYSTSQIGGYYGLLDAFYGRGTFSPDDSLLYQATASDGDLPPQFELFDTQTFAKVDSIALPITVANPYYSFNIYDMTLDHGGSNAFVVYGGPYAANTLLVVSTGRAPASLPGISISAVSSTVSAKSREEGFFVVERAFGDLTQPLIVPYTVHSRAVNGVDFAPISGTVKFAANRSTAKIVLQPLDTAIAYPVVVKLILTPGSAYTLDKPLKAKIEIVD